MILKIIKGNWEKGGWGFFLLQHVYRGSKRKLSKVSKKTQPLCRLIAAEWIGTEKPLWCDQKMVELTMLAKRWEQKVEVEITNRKQRRCRENNCQAEY